MHPLHLPPLRTLRARIHGIGITCALLAAAPAQAAAPTPQELAELQEIVQRHVAGQQAMQAALKTWNASAAQRVQAYKDGPGRQRWQDAAQQVARVRSAPPSPEAAQLWQALDAGVDTNSGRNPLARATSPQTGDELALSSTWLRQQVLGQRADGRYSYAYALNLSRLGRPGEYLMESAIFLAHARLALQIDADRCVDKALAMDVMAGHESQAGLRELDRAVKALPPKQRATAMLEAVILEETLGERPALPWLCQAPAGQPTLTQVATPSGDIGQTYVVGQAPKAPRWVDEAAWQAARRQRLQQTTNSLLPDL